MRPFVADLLKGKKALVTGGAMGIGEAITVALVHAGASVVVLDRDREAFDAMISKNQLQGLVTSLGWVQADLADPEQAVQGAKAAVAWAGGTLDIVVNNAGFAQVDNFMDIEQDVLDRMWHVNTRAPVLITQVMPSTCPQFTPQLGDNFLVCLPLCP